MLQSINNMNFMNKNSSKKGFTLIELLVVIAIIGVLSAVVLASLNTARAKSRDAKRISDLRQIRNALELYRSDNGFYPTSIDALVSSPKKYLPNKPKDPQGAGTCRPDYCYAYFPNNSTPTTYHIGAQLETVSAVESTDADLNSSGSYGGASFNGSTSYFYDLRP